MLCRIVCNGLFTGVITEKYTSACMQSDRNQCDASALSLTPQNFMCTIVKTTTKLHVSAHASGYLERHPLLLARQHTDTFGSGVYSLRESIHLVDQCRRQNTQNFTNSKKHTQLRAECMFTSASVLFLHQQGLLV
eukprot:m.1182810 g.1182810  ORF g.1182810 m.1182810 type:complete len:135 (-) comp24540_c1_seq5:3547-3951(-)